MAVGNGNFGFWHLASIGLNAENVRAQGEKPTCLIRCQMSASDPEQTLACKNGIHPKRKHQKKTPLTLNRARGG